MNDITLIAPYRRLAEVAQEVSLQLGIILDIKIGKLGDAARMARQAIREGAQLVISQGATALQIKQEDLPVPLIEIIPTGYDLLRAILEAQGKGRRLGILDHPELIRGSATMEEILGIEMVKVPLQSLQQIGQGVEIMVKQGVDVVIGNICVQPIAAARGLQTVLITCCQEAMANALYEARRILSTRNQERERAEQIRAIINFMDNGIVAVDDSGQITAINPMAERILEISHEASVGKPASIIPFGRRLIRVITTGKAEMGEVEALRNGAKLVVNFLPVVVHSCVTGAIATFQEVSRLQMIDQKVRRTLRDRGHVAKYRFHDILGPSPLTRAVVEKARNFGLVDAPVLIYGETGVGKELFAHAIHSVSPRKDGPFIAVNCAAVPESLLESELFGYAEGAFTGARKGGKPGLFELAHGGTIFLDEISEMSERLQARLLRVLQEYEVMRLGDNRVIPVDVRVITATNCDLKRLVSENRFRPDLFYRVAVLTLVIPPLRERKEDIPVLVDSFLEAFNRRFGKELKGIEGGGMELLLAYHWPGNTRELQSVLERLVILADGDMIRSQLVKECLTTDLFCTVGCPWCGRGCPLLGSGRTMGTAPAGGPTAGTDERTPGGDPGLPAGGHPGAQAPPQAAQPGFPLPVSPDIAALNDKLLRDVLASVQGNRTKAARLLGVSRTTLWRRLKGDR
jgi:transcriptional regulator with PAS, ATPase and Fis domain